MDLYCQLQDFVFNFQLVLWLQAVKKKLFSNFCLPADALLTPHYLAWNINGVCFLQLLSMWILVPSDFPDSLSSYCGNLPTNSYF